MAQTKPNKITHNIDQDNIQEPKVINLSTRTFTENEIKVLERGLKFTPTPRSKNIEGMINDMDAFCRRLR